MDRQEDNGDGLSWYYLDSVQKEFGPFAQVTMREWFTQGFFPNGSELMIRLPHWKHHVALKTVWPDVSEAFMGLPRTSAMAASVPQAFGGPDGAFDVYPTDLQPSAGARRPDDLSYLADAMQPTGAGYWGQVDAGGGNGLVGYQGMPLTPNTSDTMPGGLSRGSCGRLMPDLDGMAHMNPAMAGVSNPSMPSNLAGMPGHMVPMQRPVPGMTGANMMMPEGHTPTDAMPAGVDGQLGGFAGMMVPRPQPMQAANMPQFSGQLLQLQMQPFTGNRAAGRFRGRIKSFNAKQGFGFIENPEAHAIFGRDVFLHKAQIGNLKVGTEVTYGVEMNKFGMPQARELTTLDGKPPGPPPASVVKGGTKTRGAAKKPAKPKEDGDPGGRKAGAKAPGQSHLGGPEQ
ncbi:unnamed protein product [Effrenium voratum]|nr:unnamed protein product [Effrenium voratum]